MQVMRSSKEIQQNRVMNCTTLMKVKMMQLIVSNSLSWVQSRSYQNNLMKQLTERLLPAWNKTEAFWNICLFLASLTYYCVKNWFHQQYQWTLHNVTSMTVPKIYTQTIPKKFRIKDAPSKKGRWNQIQKTREDLKIKRIWRTFAIQKSFE